MATTAGQVESAPGISVAQQPVPLQAPKEYSVAVKNLAMVQFIIGILTIMFGMGEMSSPSSTSKEQIGCGVWAGGILTLTGAIGVFSSYNYSNRILNGVYMFHSIVSSVISVLALLIFSITIGMYYYSSECNSIRDVAIRCYDRSDVTLGPNISFSLLIFMIIEFSGNGGYVTTSWTVIASIWRTHATTIHTTYNK